MNDDSKVQWIDFVTSRFPHDQYFELYASKPNSYIKHQQFRIDEVSNACTWIDEKSSKGMNVYLCANPCHFIEDLKQRPKSENIPILFNLLIDVEYDSALRCSFYCTDDEKELCKENAEKIVNLFKLCGFDSFGLIDSGNGFHFALPCKIVNTESSKLKIKEFVESLNRWINNEYIKVDDITVNPVAGFRIPGCGNFKLDSTDDRKFRRTSLVSIPDSINHILSIEDIDAIISYTKENACWDSQHFERDFNIDYSQTLECEQEISQYSSGDKLNPKLCQAYFDKAVENICSELCTVTENRNNAFASYCGKVGSTWSKFREVFDERILIEGLDRLFHAGIATGLTSRECRSTIGKQVQYARQSRRELSQELRQSLSRTFGKPPIKVSKTKAVKISVDPDDKRSKIEAIVESIIDDYTVNGSCRLKRIANIVYLWKDSDWIECTSSSLFDSEFAIQFCRKFDEMFPDKMPNSVISIARKMLPGILVRKGFNRENFEITPNRIYLKSKYFDITTEKLYEYNPDVLNPFRMNCDIDSDDSFPMTFFEYMKDSLSEEHFDEQIKFILEFIGYCLSADTSAQKIVYLIGEPDTGKSTFLRLLSEIVGSRLCITPTLKLLTKDFGEQSLIGKRLACITDTRTSADMDIQVAIERLLAISGEDARTIERKHTTDWFGSIFTQFILAMNDFPILPDTSGAIERRLLVIKWGRKVETRDDTLITKLKKEINAIAKLSISAHMQRIKEDRKLTQPVGMEKEIHDAKKASNWVYSFVDDEIDIPTDIDDIITAKVTFDELWNCLNRWAKRNNRKLTCHRNSFGKSLAKVLKDRYYVEYEGREKKPVYYKIRLKDALRGKELGYHD